MKKQKIRIGVIGIGYLGKFHLEKFQKNKDCQLVWLIDKNIKLFACEELTFEHYGGQSHEKKFDFKAQLSRCWHYNWSKFYYFKKHYNLSLINI